jgi:hypothetical protein
MDSTLNMQKNRYDRHFFSRQATPEITTGTLLGKDRNDPGTIYDF